MMNCDVKILVSYQLALVMVFHLNSSNPKIVAHRSDPSFISPKEPPSTYLYHVPVTSQVQRVRMRERTWGAHLMTRESEIKKGVNGSGSVLLEWRCIFLEGDKWEWLNVS